MGLVLQVGVGKYFPVVSTTLYFSYPQGHILHDEKQSYQNDVLPIHQVLMHTHQLTAHLLQHRVRNCEASYWTSSINHATGPPA